MLKAYSVLVLALLAFPNSEANEKNLHRENSFHYCCRAQRGSNTNLAGACDSRAHLLGAGVICPAVLLYVARGIEASGHNRTHILVPRLTQTHCLVPPSRHHRRRTAERNIFAWRFKTKVAFPLRYHWHQLAPLVLYGPTTMLQHERRSMRKASRNQHDLH